MKTATCVMVIYRGAFTIKPRGEYHTITTCGDISDYFVHPLIEILRGFACFEIVLMIEDIVFDKVQTGTSGLLLIDEDIFAGDTGWQAAHIVKYICLLPWSMAEQP